MSAYVLDKREKFFRPDDDAQALLGDDPLAQVLGVNSFKPPEFA